MRLRMLLVPLALGGAVLAGTAVANLDGGARAPGSGWTAHPSGGDPAPVAPAGTAPPDGLTAPMRRSIRLAIEAAARDGVELRITSGWRSRERQAALYAEAVRKYGSPELARRWVLPPDESEHVTGRAVDVGPPAGADWLARHGVRFGLCRRYANEPWHFERLAGPKGSRCPRLEPHP